MRVEMGVGGELVRDEVDLALYPEPQAAAVNTEATEISIGDLHANPIKLIHFLIRENIITGLSEADYAELIRINNAACAEEVPAHFEFNAADLAAYRAILAKIRLTEPKIKLLRFVGDILADRGQNDLFILLILDQLHKLGLPLRFLLSNHDLAFLQAYENDALSKGVAAIGFSIEDHQQRSLRNLLLALTPQSPATPQTAEQSALAAEVKDIVETIYLPNLVAIDYSKADREGGAGGLQQHLTIYTHAPVASSTFKAAADWAELKWLTDTIAGLVATIDGINAHFKAQFSTPLFFNSRLFEEPAEKSAPPSPLMALAWDRWNGTSALADSYGVGDKAFSAAHAYGHQEVDSGNPKDHCLDSRLGKKGRILPQPDVSMTTAGATEGGAEFSRGTLKVYRHHTTPLPAAMAAVRLEGAELEAARAKTERLLSYWLGETPPEATSLMGDRAADFDLDAILAADEAMDRHMDLRRKAPAGGGAADFDMAAVLAAEAATPLLGRWAPSLTAVDSKTAAAAFAAASLRGGARATTAVATGAGDTGRSLPFGADLFRQLPLPPLPHSFGALPTPGTGAFGMAGLRAPSVATFAPTPAPAPAPTPASTSAVASLRSGSVATFASAPPAANLRRGVVAIAEAPDEAKEEDATAAPAP